jgi:hypothetical protein
MAKILMKLKENATREQLFTQFYGIIRKGEWTEVDDIDGEINNFILYRNDILIKEKTDIITDDAKLLNEEVFKEEILKPKKRKKKQDEE